MTIYSIQSWKNTAAYSGVFEARGLSKSLNMMFIERIKELFSSPLLGQQWIGHL